MTTPDIQSLVEIVLRLDKEATPGKWSVRKAYFDRKRKDADAEFDVFPHTDGLKKPRDIGEWSALANCRSYEPKNKVNAQLIATYRTAAPILARACNEKDAELVRLRAERTALVAKVDCHPAYLESTIDDLIEAASQVPSADRLRQAESRARKLEAELAEEKRKVEWRPIETAPKDGRWILLLNAKRKLHWVAAWSKRRAWFGYLGSTPDEPTHWMPIPALTTPSEKGETK